MEKRKVAEKLVKFLEERYGRDIQIFRSGNRDVFRVLITTILSQRTRDENTERAADTLFSRADTPEKILKLSKKELESLIRPSGPYRQKAKRIKAVSKIILEKYGGKVPKTREELMKLPGVGLKTSNVVLTYGYGKPVIAVDVHVEVVSKRLGLVSQNASVKEVEEKLEELIPIKDKRNINLGMVRFGREICITRKPKCYECPLNNICPYPNKTTTSI
ncbi:MAG: endonuclease III [Candidatus Aenigmarchaeota archaeon]|nr:endonuclease III [Candidatus Aenigmarchaeota archaeon]